MALKAGKARTDPWPALAERLIGRSSAAALRAGLVPSDLVKGAFLRGARGMISLTASDLGAKAKVSAKTIGRIEGDRVSARRSTAIALLIVLEGAGLRLRLDKDFRPVGFTIAAPQPRADSARGPSTVGVVSPVRQKPGAALSAPGRKSNSTNRR